MGDHAAVIDRGHAFAYMGAAGRQFVTVVATRGSLTGSDVTDDEIIAFASPKQYMAGW